ncbi:NADPH-dependent FMN reductase [Brevibacillus sp. SYSU BS000544]|uniref:NADPH-dependent FMN reductase n=1 Tax=Brevibacillus sp. SYSU BS000544 TaxID=3416443 RepID=UPI003CE50202
MKILVLNGSSTEVSRTRGLTSFITSELKKHHIELVTFDVGKQILPLYNGNVEQYQLNEVQLLVQSAQEADGFFLTTPEYHNGISGALKNALDFLGGKQFKNKPVAIAAVAGGGKGGINALNNLRTVMRGVYGLVLPDQFVADPVHFNEQGDFSHQDAQARVQSLVQELVTMTELVSKKARV